MGSFPYLSHEDFIFDAGCSVALPAGLQRFASAEPCAPVFAWQAKYFLEHGPEAAIKTK
jgi:hypothetical protein